MSWNPCIERLAAIQNIPEWHEGRPHSKRDGKKHAHSFFRRFRQGRFLFVSLRSYHFFIDKKANSWYTYSVQRRVAQLVRASPRRGEGRRFESARAYHFAQIRVKRRFFYFAKRFIWTIERKY